jgi:ATP-binding cassette, subfamily C, bacterial CydD
MKRKLLPLPLRQIRGTLWLVVGCGLVATALTIAQMFSLSKIVGRVFLAHGTLPLVMPLLLWLLVIIVVRMLVIWGREVLARRGAVRVKADLRQRLFAHLLRLGPAFCQGERTGELAATASEGIERLDPYISRYLPQIYLSVLAPLLILLFIFPIDWSSAVLLLITAPIIPLLMFLIGSYAEQHMQRQWLALSRMSAHFLDVIQGLTTIKLFGREMAERERIARISDGFRMKTLHVLRIAFLSGGVLEFMTTAAIGLVAVTLGIRLLNGGISFEDAFLVLLLAPEFYRPLRDLGTHRHAGMEGKASAQRIAELLETPPPVQSAAVAEQHPEQPLTLTLTDLSYTYPDATTPALQDVTLTLRPGTCTALVGRSGAGKSTLVNLLLRFLDAQGGSISVNGLPLAALPVEQWREYIALVPQRPYLFAGSVAANIRLARPDASFEEIERAAEQAGALEFIQRLPQGFETEIGEQGGRLSAGQLQRLALARAFLKDAPLLILDEPTSHLDPESESLFRHSLERLLPGRTALIIAHRYNTIANADQVAVLDAGRLIERGSPASLLASNSAFARLVESQREEVPLL